MAKRMFTYSLYHEKELTTADSVLGWGVFDSFVAEEDILVHGVFLRVYIGSWETELAAAGLEGASINSEVTPSALIRRPGTLANIKISRYISLQGAITPAATVVGNSNHVYIPLPIPAEVKEEGALNLGIYAGYVGTGTVAITVGSRAIIYYTPKRQN